MIQVFQVLTDIALTADSRHSIPFTCYGMQDIILVHNLATLGHHVFIHGGYIAVFHIWVYCFPVVTSHKLFDAAIRNSITWVAVGTPANKIAIDASISP